MELTLPDSARAEYIQIMLDAGRQHSATQVRAVTPGPPGLCWANAASFCRSGGDRYQYVEGVTRRAPSAWWEMHAYVLDLKDGHVIETTTGYSNATDYRGLPLDLPAVDTWQHRMGSMVDPGRPSIIWSLIWDALETRGEPYQLTRSFRLSRGLVVRNASHKNGATS